MVLEILYRFGTRIRKILWRRRLRMDETQEAVLGCRMALGEINQRLDEEQRRQT